jgi:uncharacterized repeat protein (TIGR01451 family)
MNDFISKISAQIIGPIILTAFFPTVLFVLALALVVFPTAHVGVDFSNAVKDAAFYQKNGLAALEITFLILVLAVVLYFLNTPIVRLYEGYQWKESVMGKLLTNRQIRKMERASLIRRCIAKARVEEKAGRIQADLSDLTKTRTAMARLLNAEYPNKSTLVLPTRLGNVIRAFETYTDRQYGAGSIAIWPRLQGVLSPSVAQALDAAQAPFNFMINSSFLALVLALLSVVFGIIWSPPKSGAHYQPWMGQTAVFLALFYLSYLGAINRAYEWGVQIKSAFDLYRFALLKQLGYETKPVDLSEERRMWQVINYKFAFPDERTYPDLPYGASSTILTVDPVSTIVTFNRTVRLVDDQSMEVRISIANLDPARDTAERVVVQDEIPTGKTYVAGSAKVNGAPATLLGSSPLKLDVGPLPYYETRTVIYSVKSQTGS